MRSTRIVHNMQTGRRLMCCCPTMPGGDFCDRDGFDLHKVVVRSGTDTIKYVFCTERHKMMFVHSHRDLGNLPAGYRGTVL